MSAPFARHDLIIAVHERTDGEDVHRVCLCTRVVDIERYGYYWLLSMALHPVGQPLPIERPFYAGEPSKAQIVIDDDGVGVVAFEGWRVTARSDDAATVTAPSPVGDATP